jgi:hypothetical protein
LASTLPAPSLLTLSVFLTLPISPVYTTAHQPPPPTAYTNLSVLLALFLSPTTLQPPPLNYSHMLTVCRSLMMSPLDLVPYDL